MSIEFSGHDIAALRAHGRVPWCDRLVFDAQSPMSEAAIVAIEAQCAGPIPQPLCDLCRITAGGSLGYGLSLEMNGQPEAISWTELFYNGSDGYRDLQGWIEHELEPVRCSMEVAFDRRAQGLQATREGARALSRRACSRDSGGTQTVSPLNASRQTKPDRQVSGP